MGLKKIIFSATGGTEKVADILIKGLDESAEKIDLLDRNREFSKICLQKDDVCMLAVPSYGGRVPKEAAERIARIKGNGAKAILLVVYGNREYDDTLLELKEVAKKSGFLPVVAVAAVAEHSIMHQFAKGRPDKQDREELLSYVQFIRERIENPKLFKVPGKKPYRAYGKIPLKPQIKRTCNHCGKCAKECPAGAISMGEYIKLDKNLCISCMRCVAVCPRHARKLSPVLVKLASHKLKKVCRKRKKNEIY